MISLSSLYNETVPTANNLSITAVIIAKNEEKMIANCIESLRWCSEILVIDNGSDDATPQVAESIGARVISHKTESFADLRERALKHVKTDWLFYIDADERVTPMLAKEVAVHLETNSAQALRFRRENVLYGKTFHHGGWQHDYVTRVFQRKALSGWEGDIHESPVFEGEAITLHSPLIHLTHRSTVESLKKTISWTPMEARLLHEANAEPVTLMTLMRKGGMAVIRGAIFKQGSKDGIEGWIEAVVQGINRVLVYIQLWELQQSPTLPEKYQHKEEEIAQMWKAEIKQQAKMARK